MFKHILIPTDGSALSEKAINAGIDFAKSIGAKVTGFCAIEELPWAYGGYIAVDPRELEEEQIESAKKNLAVIENYAHTVKVPYEGVWAKAHAPYEGIIKMAEENRCDLIFMASHGRHGLGGLLLGSETTKVLTHCNIPVLVYR